ncbi:MAG: class I SAM-dependent methyltransferase [Lacunisphaera sp.]|nr:class I SAM-dependent methyltransferase [Lacunisphaera sp.]
MNNSPSLLPDYLKILREKWREVPSSTQDRTFSSDLLALADADLLRLWQGWYDDNCAGAGYSTRGWYHDLYAPLARTGGAWLEIGSGLGYDGIFFAQQGAQVTFLDIVEGNLQVIERLCGILGVKQVNFRVLTSLEDIRPLGTFDCILAVGSLINAPFDLMCAERNALATHLRRDGRWLELCYPRERWEREGSLPFSEWGKKTDGDRTPWVEWYDLEKLQRSLQPHRFETVLDINFHNHDFNWFDLTKRS